MIAEMDNHVFQAGRQKILSVLSRLQPCSQIPSISIPDFFLSAHGMRPPPLRGYHGKSYQISQVLKGHLRHIMRFSSIHQIQDGYQSDRHHIPS